LHSASAVSRMRRAAAWSSFRSDLIALGAN
jgi:hypothetical protein